MTATRDKLRSLVLAVLLVLSAFAGTVAFSGTVAAATNTSISPTQSDIGQTETYTIEADAEVSDSLESIDVDFNGGVNLGNFDDSNVTLDVGSASDVGVSTSTSGDTATITLDSAESVSPGETITLDVEVTNSDNAGDYTASVDLNYAGTTNGFSVSYELLGSNNRVRLDDADAVVDSGSLRWQGQKLFLKDLDAAGETWELREADDVDGGKSIGGFVTQISLDNNGEAIIDTGELGDGGLEGDYVIVNTDGEAVVFNSNGRATGTETSPSGIEDASFEVATQDFSASFSEGSVASGTATLNLDSNRAQYDLLVSSDSLGTDSLMDIFEDEFSPTEANDDQIRISVSSQGLEASLNFSDIEAGEYTFDFEVADTGKTDSATIENVQGEDASASFRRGNVFTAGEGDVATIPIEIEGTDQVTINVGSTQKNFLETLTLQDGDDNGRITLEVNTYLAGRSGVGVDAYDVVDDDDDIVEDQFVRHTEPISEPPLDPTFYELNLTVGGSEKAIGTLSITDRVSRGVQSLTAPNSQFGEYEDAAELTGSFNDTVTSDDRIAYKDSLLIEIQSTSVLGALAAANDGGDSTAEAFVDMIRGEGVIDPQAFDFSIRQQDPEANQDPKWLDLDETENAGGLNVITDQQNGSLYVELRTDRMRMVRVEDPGDVSGADGDLSVGTGERYTANFTIGDDSGMVDNDQSIEDTFRIVERSLTFDTAEDGRVHVYPAPGQIVSGTSTVAPGTQLDLRLRKSGQRAAFLKDPSPVVEPDGTFESTVDFSDQPGNVTFDIEARSFDDLDVEGYIEPRRTANGSMSDQTLAPGEAVLIEDVELSEGGFIALHRNSPDGEIVGSSGYIEPNTETDVRIPINVAGTSVSLAAVPHLDGDGNRRFNAVFDQPYEENGTVISFEAQMTILTPTPTPTTTAPPTLTPTPTPTATPTLTPTATLTPINTTTNASEQTTTTTGPGFTLGLAVLALAGAALLVARRFD